MTRNQQRLHAQILGRVQGVSFRYYTVNKARELGLVGWTMNRHDGSVEVVAEGERNVLETLHTWLHQGSPSARVDRVQAQWGAATGEFRDFGVRYASG